MRTDRRAFTLIEMLVVIAIIGILAGMVFRMIPFATREASVAECVKKLESIQHALEEYRAEYGEYPATTTVYYEYENVTNQTGYLRNTFLPDNPAYSATPVFVYGLVSFLWPRERGCIEHTAMDSYVQDTQRDKNAKERWSRFLDDINLYGTTVPDDPAFGTGYQAVGAVSAANYWNNRQTIRDPWDREIRYVCTAPFLTYKMWSKGPNGVDGDDDDIHLDSGWDE